jgi:uracil-DNA glycosylase family 4
MRWTERQRAMLREMGVRLWARDTAVLGSAASRDAKIVAAGGSPAEPVRPMPAPSPPSALPEVPAPGGAEWMPADWLVVGESFGAVAGAPSGLPAGEQERLLAAMLRAIGVSHDAPTRAGRACFITLGEAAPQAVESMLDRVRPRLMLALGRVAAEALLGVDEPLGRLRGKVHERAGVSVVVTFALAYLLRNPTEKAKAWSDLCLAVAALEAPARAC